MATGAKTAREASRRGSTRPRLSDDELLTGLARHEPWAATALFEHLESAVERSLLRVLQQRGSDFEDLFQITFERIVRTLAERRFSAQCSLSTWASAIATHVAIDTIRAQVRERRLFRTSALDEPLEAFAPATPDRAELRAEIRRLQNVLAEMQPAQAEALLLHDGLGYDLVEIAEIEGVTVAAAQSRLVRGRKDFLRRAGCDAEPSARVSKIAKPMEGSGNDHE
jgi:RNA polymerase sigma-70 factor (ECF subfamily)